MPESHGPWQRPDYHGDDIYPGFGCWDRMRAGGVNIGGTRQLVHDLLWTIIGDGWDHAVSDFGDQRCTGDEYARFLHDLLDVRGEFGRLLLTLAAAVRQEGEQDEAGVEAHFAEAHPGETVCNCGTVDHVAWWQDPDLSRPVVEQLRRCLACLPVPDITRLLADSQPFAGDLSLYCTICGAIQGAGDDHRESCAWRMARRSLGLDTGWPEPTDEPTEADPQLAELWRLHEAALPAPWRWTDFGELACPLVEMVTDDGDEPPYETDVTVMVEIGGPPSDADAVLMVAARNALPSLLDEIDRLRALVGGRSAPTPTRDARQLLDKAAAHLAYLTREPDSWWDDEHCLDNGQSAVIIDHLAVALRAALLGQPATTDVRNTVYDPESDRWCCTVCDQWSDEGAGAATIDHLDHGQPAPTPTREQVDAHGFTDAEHDRDVMAEPLVFTYTNHRGETAERHVSPHRLEWGATEWHPETQWLLWAYDIDRNAERTFSLRALVGGRSAAPPDVDGPWRASSSNTVTIVAGGRHPITDEMYPFAMFHQGKPADLYMATVIARLLNTAEGGRSAAPTRDELRDVAIDALKAAIDFDRDNPITADPDGFIAEQTDRIVGAAGSSSSYVPSTGKGRAESEVTRQQLIRVLDDAADGEDLIDVVHAADAVLGLFSRSAAEPPEDAALRVIRRLRDYWDPDTESDPPVWYLEPGIDDGRIDWDGTEPMFEDERRILVAAADRETAFDQLKRGFERTHFPDAATERPERCAYCGHGRPAHRSTVGEGDPLTHCRACACGAFIDDRGVAAEPPEDHGVRWVHPGCEECKQVARTLTGWRDVAAEPPEMCNGGLRVVLHVTSSADPLAQALALLRSHADVCSRYGEPDWLRAEADRIESLAGVAAEPPAKPQPDTMAYNVALLAAPACPLCRDTGMVPATGRGSDGFDPCPDCCGVAAEPNEETGDGA